MEGYTIVGSCCFIVALVVITLCVNHRRHEDEPKQSIREWLGFEEGER